MFGSSCKWTVSILLGLASLLVQTRSNSLKNQGLQRTASNKSIFLYQKLQFLLRFLQFLTFFLEFLLSFLEFLVFFREFLVCFRKFLVCFRAKVSQKLQKMIRFRAKTSGKPAFSIGIVSYPHRLLLSDRFGDRELQINRLPIFGILKF
jgi:hypothetical protein